jgi:hypothetical protein
MPGDRPEWLNPWNFDSADRIFFSQPRGDTMPGLQVRVCVLIGEDRYRFVF